MSPPGLKMTLCHAIISPSAFVIPLHPTLLASMEACSGLGVHQAFTSYSDPQGHADTDRSMRTLREEPYWLQEWSCPFELLSTLYSWIVYYNHHYLHSPQGQSSTMEV
jgi:hypothetical protein